MEIVSEPDMRTPDEAYAYLTALKQIMQYAGIGDCDMEKGQLRCDVNVSVRPVGETRFGTKIEIKNLNSFRSVHRSLVHEIERQQAVLEAGGTLVQETRAWNDDDGATFLLRRKESAHDYRYFPEPDLMPMTFSENDIEAIRAALPELPEARRARFVADFSLTPYDAAVLTAEKPLSDYFETAAPHTRAPKILANWIISELMRELGSAGIAITECKIAPSALAALVECIQDGTVSGRLAKDVFTEMIRTGDLPRQILSAKGLLQVSDEGEIVGLVTAALDANPAQVAQYRAGNPKVLQFLVGQVMKLSRGKANPQMVNELLRKNLDG
jgi:aspartyl-tRNA(Asn)/glutamyl-tRNA(Gln) amidotransferase subunit B